MATTKTKSENYADTLAAAQSLAVERAATRDAVRQALAELRQRLAQGDDTVKTADLMTASADVERAELLADAATRNVNRIKRDAPADTTVADALAPVLSDALGVPVKVVESIPTKHATIPAAYVRQVKPSAPVLGGRGVPGDGTVTAVSELVYVRTPLHREVSPDTIREALAATTGEYGVTEPCAVENDGTVTDMVRIDAPWTYPMLPWFESVNDPTAVRHVAEDLAYSVKVRSLTHDAQGVGVGFRFAARAEGHDVTTTTKGGVRTSTVTATVHVWEPGVGGVWDASRLAPVQRTVDGVARQHVGLVLPGIGRVKRASASQSKATGDGKASVTFTLTCEAAAA